MWAYGYSTLLTMHILTHTMLWSDLILLLFDAHKLDISDEFRSVINTLKPHSDKIKVVLNKADMVSNQALMRVYVVFLWQIFASDSLLLAIHHIIATALSCGRWARLSTRLRWREYMWDHSGTRLTKIRKTMR